MADSGDADLLRTSAEVVLPPDPRSARAARAFTAARLDEAGCSDEEKASAALVVSELVTNAVLHAHTEATLRVQVHDDRIVLHLEDGSPDLPEWRERSDWDVDGRGLSIMSTLGEVDVTPTGPGKVVAVSLPRR